LLCLVLFCFARWLFPAADVSTSTRSDDIHHHV
jgi:hypothetical protein